jgi:RNA polymerase sigma factor (sigma-70 family)
MSKIPKKNNNGLTFEENYELIDKLLERHRYKWKIKAVMWLDFDDVKQIILSHIYKKWSMYDPSQRIQPWLNTLVSNQIKNLFRNILYNKTKPCTGCPEAIGDTGCHFCPSKLQSSECQLYAKWEKSKKSSFNINIPLSLTFHEVEVFNRPDESFDLTNAQANFHAAMKESLSEKQFIVYELLYIKNVDEKDISKIMNWKTNETTRNAGYARLNQLKKIFYEKAKEVVKEIDLF